MNIKINAEILEMMLFFWQSTSEKEKVSDTYLTEIGARKEMKVLFSEFFNEGIYSQGIECHYKQRNSF